MKYFIVFFAILIVSVPVVKAEDKSWYEIDGIRLRYGSSEQDVIFRTTSDESDETILSAEGRGEKDIFPLAIVFTETLMSSFTFRGAFLEFSEKTSINEIAPTGEQADRNYRQSANSRNLLYNNFFNASDKSFADANSKWALSADTDFTFGYLGYYWGMFLPIGKHHRFFKIGLGLSLLHSKISVKLYLCEEYYVEDHSSVQGPSIKLGEATHPGTCKGKKEIDSGEITETAIEPVTFIVLWERVSENSIWQFIKFSGNIVERNLGGNLVESDLLRRKSKIEYKNHNNTTFNTRPMTRHRELISYTYRF